MTFAAETSQDSSSSEKSEKAEKPEKKGNTQVVVHRLIEWGSPHNPGDHKEFQAALQLLHHELMLTFRDLSSANGSGWIDLAMKQCESKCGRYSGKQSDPGVNGGILAGYTLYFFTLPCDVEVAILVPPLIEIRSNGPSVYVRGCTGKKYRDELVALIEHLGSCVED